jgi:hypothetical protein
MIIKINPSIIPYDNLLESLCKAPYHGHPHGCPNYGKKEGCPPRKPFEDIFNLNKNMYVIYTEFPVGEFAERMRMTHPEWKELNYPDHSKKTNNFMQSFENKLREKHPDWPEEYFAKKNKKSGSSAKEWYNPRRWQPAAKKNQRIEETRFLNEYPGLILDKCPEASGINLTALMYKLGIELKWQWPPIHDIKNKSYIISIGGHPANQELNE